jgi:chemotaxis family two-component system sensor kinase Cph1
MMTPLDLTNCDREPIHIPGSIQSHGFLVAMNFDLKITYCSENIELFAPVNAVSLLGTPVYYLETVILRKMNGFIANLIDIAQNPDGFHPINPFLLEIAGNQFNLIIAAAKDQYLLEFEPAASDLEPDMQQAIGATLSEILTDGSLSRLLNKTAWQIRKLIIYDRVMVYKFHDDGHGEVVAEAKNDELDSWIGLHYPASDIPKQARSLYKLNFVRLIADVTTVPSPVITYKEFNGLPLDLTDSTLRAVSPIHIQYLKNMGVASSFSVSLIHKGELWGLVACHNYTPRYIHFQQREMAKLVGQVLSSALSFRQQEDDLHKSDRLKNAVAGLTRQLLHHSDLEDALFKHDISLLDAADAGGAVLAYKNQFFRIGETPGDTFMTSVVSWLQDNMLEAVYATSCFSEEYPSALVHTAIASGMLACRLSRELNEYIIWFRPEVAAIVKWAGNPDKAVKVSETGLLQISPRASFETWTQTVQRTSAPWTSEDFNSAIQLREEVVFAISRKAAEIRVLNDKLKEANDELDAFSYTISHDLKNPLTTIKSYSQILKKNLKLEPREQSMLEGILSSAKRMQSMIEEVLHYSKAGQIKAKHCLVDMNALLEDLKQQLLVAHEPLPVTINIGHSPSLYGDKTMIHQVFANLVGNAVKYSSKTALPVVTISGEQSADQVRYQVTDNGIGIKIHDLGKIFDLFSRSKEVDAYEGSGVGLAIVKKIMEKHSGRIWVDSVPGAGSTFHVVFQTADKDIA